jgi:hypothetical protein
VFVHKGTSDYIGGFNLGANERLIGEAANLVVGSDTLHTGDPAKRPTITDTNADVVDLVGIIEVRGLEIDPSGAGGGIAGATGDTGGGTIEDVRIIDTHHDESRRWLCCQCRAADLCRVSLGTPVNRGERVPTLGAPIVVDGGLT